MSNATASSCLAANLEVIGARQQPFVQAIRGATATPGLQLEVTSEGVHTGTLAGRRLASRHQPLEEGQRIAEGIDVRESAVVTVLGFGLGWHVKALAARMKKAGVIIVFEPDLDLLRAVLEQIDHSSWMSEALIVWAHDAEDLSELASVLDGAESIIAQGVGVIQHPASRARLGDRAVRFHERFAGLVKNTRTTLTTTLVRSQNTIENLLLNFDHYASRCGIADLKDHATDRLGIVVSAGPSLRKNIDLLAHPGVRERCVIIAVQTALKPLLQAGVKPHFVTALDYHEISKRFYEGLTADDVRDVTLVIDPKVSPAVPEAFPGAVRCCASSFLDKVLGDLATEMGTVPAGATVAHLALYVAQYLGCNPIAMIGQDLGFTDGLYYAHATAIHDIWATELNPFNTIEMMEWQRIVRHRLHLHKRTDQSGKSIFTDAQMLAYLQQFEVDFSKAAAGGTTIIDATEGGVHKAHTTVRTLAETVAQFADTYVEPTPLVKSSLNASRTERILQRLHELTDDIKALRSASEDAASLLQRMKRDQRDATKMQRHFRAMDRHRAIVNERFETFELLNHLNQLGVFKRHKADRIIHLAAHDDPYERQLAQLDRDIENVRWLSNAAEEMLRLLASARGVLSEAQTIHTRLEESRESSPRQDRIVEPKSDSAPQAGKRIAAMIPLDPAYHSAALRPGDDGKTILQRTLERVSHCTRIPEVILLCPDDFDVERVINRNDIRPDVSVEHVGASPFGPEHRAIHVARKWSDTCWRGGIAGLSAFDDVLCPVAMWNAMRKHELDAGVLIGPDWPLVNPSGEDGCDALVNRYLEHPDEHSIVFTQSPPGLCGCLIAEPLMREFAADRNRLATIGAMLTYQPHAPQADPIARDANVQIDSRVRRSMFRVVYDCAASRETIDCLLEGEPGDAASIASEAARRASEPAKMPSHIVLELTTEAVSQGEMHRLCRRHAGREPLSFDDAQRLFDQIDPHDEILLTLAGAGDPLLHPAFDDICNRARDAGVSSVHMRTALVCDRSTIDRLLSSPVDIVSVDLHADRAATYQTMMGGNHFRQALENMDALLGQRTRLSSHEGSAGFGLPWIVPRVLRCLSTYDDIESFFDRWMSVLGTCVIEGAPWCDDAEIGLTQTYPPPSFAHAEMRQQLIIRSNGEVTAGTTSVLDDTVIGNAAGRQLRDLWRDVLNARATHLRTAINQHAVAST